MDFPLLESCPVGKCLSERGKRMFMPQGIIYWAGRGREEAEYNATIGSARGPESDVAPGAPSEQSVYYLPALTSKFSTPPRDVVSYAPVLGVPRFRDAWKGWVLGKCPGVDPEHISRPAVIP
ncbi:MAG: hypothetical protein ACTSU5_12480, partial [Promethearchaeota archaeon]